MSRLGRIDDRGGYFAGDFGGCCHESEREKDGKSREKERERRIERKIEGVRATKPRSAVSCACQNLNVIACISVLVINSNCAPLTKSRKT